MNNADYWNRRFKIMEDALKDRSYEYVQNLDEQFNAAIAEIDTKMRAWYQRFAVNNNISYADAQKLLKSDELKEFKWTIDQYIKAGKENAVNGAWMKELENASARVHISRLESLKIELRQQAEALTASRVQATAEAAKDSYIQSYYHTAFEVQHGLGVGWTMQSINSTAIEKVLSRPWTTDNQTFTARCWTDKNKLVETVNRELTRMIAIGEAPDKAIANIVKQFNVSKSNAGRVVMTESAYFSSAAQKDCFNELDVEQYRIVSALDKGTCDICGSMDGKVFKMSEYEPGVTANPFHPWCRCCTAPYFADMEEIGARYARDVVSGKSYKLSKDVTYEQWKKMQDNAHGAGTVDKMRKMHYNESADKAQWSSYKKRLGDEVPETFEDFQTLKYDKPEIYKNLCGLYSYKGRVPEATVADYKAYKAVKATGVVGSVRVPPEFIDTACLTFNDSHAGHHGCTLEDAVSYVEKAKCSIVRKRWDGYSVNYYSVDGATYVDKETQKIKTAYSKTDYDSLTQSIMEVF